MQTIIIVAMTPDRLIGKGGALPWHEPEDLKHFKRTTMGHAVVMGRKTFDSIGRPLPGRRNIVISRDSEALKRRIVNAEGGDVAFVGSLDEAIDLCRRRREETAFIVGGAQIYALALPLVDEMIVTYIDRPGLAGDTYFPEWREEDWEASPYPASGALRIVRYRRRGE